jgi:enterochelin esterase-like enzyme
MFTTTAIKIKTKSSTAGVRGVFIFLATFLATFLLGLQGCGGNGSHNSNSGPIANTSSLNLSNAASSRQDDSQVPRSIIQYNTIASDALKTTMGYAIYLPADYNPDQRYPVLYIMYGYGGNQYSMFNSFLSVNRTADKMIAQGSMKPMILVVPDYKNSFAVNSTLEQNPKSGGGTIGLYEDYLIEELIPHIDQQFSTDESRDGRFIEGYSMGGFAALYLGFNYPELFSKIGAHSSALWDYTKSDLFIGQRDWLYTTPELRAQRDPFLLAKSQKLRNTYVYLDVGSGDALYGVNERFYLHLLAQGIRVQWHTSNGGHDVSYWGSNTENYFRFY